MSKNNRLNVVSRDGLVGPALVARLRRKGDKNILGRCPAEVQCELDSSGYAKGRKVTDAVMNTVKLRPHRFHGEWNYTIEPH